MKLFAAIFIAIFIVDVIEGLQFENGKYAIVLSNNYPAGPIGKINVRDSPEGVIYTLATPSTVLEIDRNSGELNLLVEISPHHNNSKFNVSARNINDMATTEVQFFVLFLNHGDAFALDAVQSVRKNLNIEEVSAPTIFIPTILDVIAQQVAAGYPATNMSIAEEIVTMAITVVKSAIRQVYEKLFGKSAVLAFLQNSELFSSAAITKMRKEALCREITSPVTCLKKPKYRRIDGRCSNLKYPIAGGTGTPLERIRPAEYYDASGLNDPVGFPNQQNRPNLPSPFNVTKNFIKDEVASSTDPELTPLMMQFGQFLDHDLTLSAEESGGIACLRRSCDGSETDHDARCYPILPLENSQPPCIKLIRSAAMCQRDGYPDKRQQINEVTAVIDGNNIYGSSEKTTDILRDKKRVWTQIESSTRMKQIDTGMTSEIWAVNHNNDVFRLKADKTWENIEGKIKHVTAGESGIWGVDANNDVYHYSRSVKWKHVPGIKLKQIDSGPEGILVGVTESNEVYYRIGLINANHIGKEWVKIDGSLSYISCGALGCWGTDSTWHVYYIDGISQRSCAASSMVSIDGRMKQIEVGVVSDVYGINPAGSLHVRVHVSAANVFGTDWKPLREASYVTTGWTGQYLLVDGILYQSSDDEGLLRTSQGNLLPHDTSCRASSCVQTCFIAGDIRVNDQQALTAFHTLFVREHNRIAKQLRILNRHWNGEKLFQETRKIVGGVKQKIVYEDYLPILLGTNPLPAYTGYNEDVNPGIINAFTLAYRLGHSMIRSKFDLLNANFDPIVPAVKLRFLFFNSTFVNTYGVEPLLLGLVGNISERVDTHLTKEITEHLFQRGNKHGENLAALNIQRSRDHGLPGYNAYREFCGLSKATSFGNTSNEIQDPENRRILKELYNDDPSLTELWVAGIAESPVPGAVVGPTLRCVVAEQFRRTRDGDRFFYENDGIFTPLQRKEIKKTTISRIYCDNVNGIVSMQRNAFKSSVNQSRPLCSKIPGISLCYWKECLTGEPKLDPITQKCMCGCKENLTYCHNKWAEAPGYTPPYPIHSNTSGDYGSRFVDLNGDGSMDFVYNLWTPNKVSKGAFINDPDSKTFVSATNFQPPYSVAANNGSDLGTRFVDLNGDGKADFVYNRRINPVVVHKGAYLNTGQGWMSSPQYIPPFHIAHDNHGDLGTRFIELNGDGKVDFVYHRRLSGGRQQKGAYINTGNGWEEAPQYIPPYPITNDEVSDSSTRFVDINGDGRMDLVYHRWRNGNSAEKGAYINNGTTWVWSPEFTPPFHITSGCITDLGARFVDLNGDGRVDFVYHRWINRKVAQKGAYINNGYQWVWTPEYIPPFQISADHIGDLGAKFVDINGDGLNDMVWHIVWDGKIHKGAAINTGCGWKLDSSFSPPYNTGNVNRKDSGARFVELNGDGIIDMVWKLEVSDNSYQEGATLACTSDLSLARRKR